MLICQRQTSNSWQRSVSISEPERWDAHTNVTAMEKVFAQDYVVSVKAVRKHWCTVDLAVCGRAYHPFHVSLLAS